MTPEDIEDLFETWNAALLTGNPDEITRLYAPDAILLPTASNQVRHTPAEICDYFTGFMARRPAGTINESNTRTLTDHLVSNSGVYTFDLGDGSRLVARFSFLYRKRDDRWQIIEHHSSAMPEG